MAFSGGNFDCLGHVISIVSTPQSGWSGVFILEGRKTFLFSKTTRHALGPTQLYILGVTGFLSGIVAARVS
jgi:hypothetical protein